MTDDIEVDAAGSHMSSRMTTRIEIVGRLSGRRRWTVEQKLGTSKNLWSTGA